MNIYSRFVLILILAVANSYNIWSQHMGPSASDPERASNYGEELQKSNRDSLITWQEKVLLHLADDQAPNRSMIFFKGYLLTGTKNLRVNMSKVLKVELLDLQGEVVLKQYHPINEGMITGNLEIPKKLPAGQYYLRAYTRWMQNYGEASYAVKPIFIGRAKSRTEAGNSSSGIEIYPEGGHLLNGLHNRVVMRTDRQDGATNSLSGKITDTNGKVVSSLTAYPADFFTASFVAQRGNTYKVEMSDGTSYSIPEAKDNGCLLQVNNLDREMIRVRIMATPEYQGAQLKLIGDFDGIPYLERYLNINQQGKVEFEIPKKEFPRGIAWLKLIDETGLELSARPVWIDKNGVKLAIRPKGKAKQQAGEMVLEVEVTDLDDNPIETEVALSITKNPKTFQLSDTPSIDFEEFDLFPVAEKLEGSKGLDRVRQQRFMDDLRLLCSAAEIRRDIDATVEEKGDNIRFPFQDGLELIGFAYDINNKLLRDTPIQVMAFSETDLWVQDIESDSNGRVILQNLQLKGMTELVFRTQGEASQERMVKVIPAKTAAPSKSTEREKTLVAQEKKRIYEATDQTPSDTTGLIELQEVVVQEKEVNKSESPSIYGITPTRIEYQDPERPKSIPELLLNIPNIVVRGIGSINPVVINLRSAMAGGGPILFVLDGFPISQGQGRGGLSSIASNPLVEIMNAVPAGDVERIEFLMGPEAAMFGSRSNGGVLLFYTRTGAELKRSERKEAQLIFQGYEPPVDFVEYKANEPRKVRESSTTLYWNPTVSTGADGKATLRLLIPDDKEPVIIQASTVTKEGGIGKFSAPLPR